MNANEQIIEVVGWHAWCDGDGIKKVDRCIRLGNKWHYHVIEDEEGNTSDNWSFDYEQLGENPLIFPTKFLAEKEEERQKKEHEKSKEARISEEDAEDAPLVEKLASLPFNRIQRIVEKTDRGLVAVWDSWKVRMENIEEAIDIVQSGSITHTIKGRKTFIPLTSIDHVAIEGDDTRVTTKSGDSYLYEGKQWYMAITIALTFFNTKYPN